ncbi:Ig-like domain-containing protein [Wenzhouxiangella marina]|nr:Ig-like domain-containing protein [Wenzhouxiangella marina]MBB6087262.1 hypothetical protein [Wenzhouxiangella marina]
MSCKRLFILIPLLAESAFFSTPALAGGDTTPPAVVALDPVDNATNVTPRPNVSVVFDETIVLGTGAVQIRRADNDELVGNFIPANTGRVQLSTTNVTDDTMNINWINELEEETEYYMVLSNGSAVDLAGNAFPGLGVSDTTEWSFTTGDESEPEPVALTPSDDQTNVDPTGVLVAEFNDEVQAGTGNLSLYSGTQMRALEEGFDDTSRLSPTSVDLFSSNGIGSYFGINFGAGDGSGIWGGDPNPTNTTDYIGLDGNYFDASQLGSSPRDLDWDDIDISALTNLAFSGQFAAPAGWGPDDYVQILIDIDNSGSFTEILEFRGDGDNIAREELTGAPFGSGVPLRTEAKRFALPISGTGSTLDLRISVRTSAGGERVAMDNIIISGILNSPTLVEQVPIGDPSIQITGNVLTYQPSSPLSLFVEHFVIIDEGAIVDTSTNANALNDLTASSAWNFVTGNLGTLIVQKETLPDGSPQNFTFTGDAAGMIQDGQQIVVSGLAPGSYSSTEQLPLLWTLSSIVCDDGNSSGDLASATATFVVDANETVTCVFTNTELGPIIFQDRFE